MREGSAEVGIACPAETAFAFLVDPRNADAWFANVALEQAPARPLRVGATWTFTMTRQHGQRIPMRMATYQSPQTFTWETTYPAWRDNLQWTLALTAAPGDASAEGETRLRLTIRQRPGPLGWPLLAVAQILTLFRVTQGASMAARAERAAENASAALDALPSITYDAERASQRHPRRKSGRRR